MVPLPIGFFFVALVADVIHAVTKDCVLDFGVFNPTETTMKVFPGT